MTLRTDPWKRQTMSGWTDDRPSGLGGPVDTKLIRPSPIIRPGMTVPGKTQHSIQKDNTNYTKRQKRNTSKNIKFNAADRGRQR